MENWKFKASQRLFKSNTSKMFLVLADFELFEQFRMQQLITINLQIFPKNIGIV